MYSLGLSSIGGGKCLKLHQDFAFMLGDNKRNSQQMKIQFANLPEFYA